MMRRQSVVRSRVFRDEQMNNWVAFIEWSGGNTVAHHEPTRELARKRVGEYRNA